MERNERAMIRFLLIHSFVQTTRTFQPRNAAHGQGPILRILPLLINRNPIKHSRWIHIILTPLKLHQDNRAATATTIGSIIVRPLVIHAGIRRGARAAMRLYFYNNATSSICMGGVNTADIVTVFVIDTADIARCATRSLRWIVRVGW